MGCGRLSLFKDKQLVFDETGPGLGFASIIPYNHRLDDLVIETTDAVKITIRCCTSFGNQDMDMRMEVDAINEGLNHSHYSRHKLKVCGGVEEFHKCTDRRETEIIEELSLEAEKKTQHPASNHPTPHGV